MGKINFTAQQRHLREGMDTGRAVQPVAMRG